MHRRLVLPTLLLTVLCSACGSAPPTTPTPVDPGPSQPPPPPPPPPVPPTLGINTILSFGDSMTAGTTSPTFRGSGLTAGLAESYPYKLQTLLSARYSAQTISVGNAGHAGNRAVDDGGRLSHEFSVAKPQLVLLLEGANDLNNLGESRDVTLIVGAMEDMVKDVTYRGGQVMLATLPPQRLGGKGVSDPSLLDKYNRELRTMAGKKGAILVDVNAQLPLSMIGQDGLHPTEAGYQKMAEIFLDAIKARFETDPGG